MKLHQLLMAFIVAYLLFLAMQPEPELPLQAQQSPATEQRSIVPVEEPLEALGPCPCGPDCDCDPCECIGYEFYTAPDCGPCQAVKRQLPKEWLDKWAIKYETIADAPFPLPELIVYRGGKPIASYTGSTAILKRLDADGVIRPVVQSTEPATTTPASTSQMAPQSSVTCRNGVCRPVKSTRVQSQRRGILGRVRRR